MSVKNALGTLAAVIFGFLAIADVPTQLAQWKTWWASAVAAIDWTGNGPRWAFLVMAVLVGLWAWDVHRRLLSKWSAVLPSWLSGLLTRLPSKPWQQQIGRVAELVANRFTGVEERIDKLTERVSNLESHTDISGLRKHLVDTLVHHKMVDLAKDKPWTINSARYGIGEAPDQSQDVLAALESYRHQDKIEIIVNNETMRTGNIFAGLPKTLYVQVTQGGMWQKLEVKETHKLVLPPTTFTFKNSGLTVDRATDLS
jgi:hypothetical protein